MVLQGESNEVARVHRRETPGDQCICERHGGGSHLVALGKATSESSFTIQQSAMEQALCARLGDAGKTTGRWD